MSASLFNLGYGAIVDMLPIASTLSFINAFTQAFPDEELNLAEMSRGQLAVKFKSRVPELIDMHSFGEASEFVDTLAQDSSTHDYQKIMIIQEAFEDRDQWLKNAISGLDIILFGLISASIFLFAKRNFLTVEVVPKKT